MDLGSMQSWADSGLTFGIRLRSTWNSEKFQPETKSRFSWIVGVFFSPCTGWSKSPTGPAEPRETDYLWYRLDAKKNSGMTVWPSHTISEYSRETGRCFFVAVCEMDLAQHDNTIRVPWKFTWSTNPTSFERRFWWISHGERIWCWECWDCQAHTGMSKSFKRRFKLRFGKKCLGHFGLDGPWLCLI